MKHLLCALCILLCSCGEKKNVVWKGIFFGIPFEMHIAEPISRERERQIDTALSDTFRMIDQCANHWNASSEIAQVNQSCASTIVLSEELRAIVETALSFREETDGDFDPSLKNETSAWKEALQCGALPQERMHSADVATLTSEGLSKPKGVRFDFDGMLKGYAVDRIAAQLKKIGVRHFLINWSGEIYASGHHPDRRPWRIKIPSGRVLELHNEALATSGSQEQNATIANVRYTHIIDPKSRKALTIEPSTPQAITVKAASCARADALATALMCRRAAYPECEIFYCDGDFVPGMVE